MALCSSCSAPVSYTHLDVYKRQSVYYSNTTTASDQSILGGETAAMGTVVDVQFSNIVEDGAVDSR